jgi:hypothetical protein
MKVKHKLTAAIATVTLFAAGAANAALNDGLADASANTSVFISVVERNSVNQVVRNLVIDTGARTLETFGGTPWSTSIQQESQILAFLGTAAVDSTVRFNVGGALNDLSFATDLRGFLTSGSATGPGAFDFTALDSGVGNINTFIGNSNPGVFNPAGVQAANGPADAGWHVTAWDNSVGGAILPSNEILLGAGSQLTGWRLDLNTFEINRFELGPLTSNLLTGDISFGVQAAVPVPAAVWLFGSALGLLGALRRRMAA